MTMPPEATRQQISVFLLKESVSLFDDALLKPSDWQDKWQSLDFGDGTESRLYLKLNTRGGLSKWMKFLQQALPDGSQNPFRGFNKTSAGALVLLKVTGAAIARKSAQLGSALPRQDRWFALCYGFGRMFLNYVWEPRFGFRIALNVAEERWLHQIGLEQYRGQSIQREVTSSRLSDLGALGFDKEQDIIKKVVAKLDQAKKDFGYRVTGRDNVSLSCDLSVEAVRDKCIELLVAHSREDYKQKFPGVEEIVAVADKSLIATLDDIVVGRIADGSMTKVHFAPPDPVAYDENFGGFKFAARQDLEPEEEISPVTLRTVLGSGVPVTLQALKAQRVIVVAGDDSFRPENWPVYQTIVAEVDHGGRVFALMGGEWFEFEANYVRALNQHVDALPQASYLTSHGRHGHTSEDAYLLALKPRSGLGLIVGHKEFVSFGGGHNKTEVCDLLVVNVTPNRHALIHVKGTGGGKEFGHLVNQGLHSLELLIDKDPSFRCAALSKLQTQAQNNGVVLPSQLPEAGHGYELVFAVFMDTISPLSNCLTLFSKVALRRADNHVYKFGCTLKVELMLP